MTSRTAMRQLTEKSNHRRRPQAAKHSRFVADPRETCAPGRSGHGTGYQEGACRARPSYGSGLVPCLERHDDYCPSGAAVLLAVDSVAADRAAAVPEDDWPRAGFDARPGDP